jgi:hypothetical protein
MEKDARESRVNGKVGTLFKISIPMIGAILAVVFGVSLFIVDGLGLGGFETHAIVEALALIFIGISFMTLCFTFCKDTDRYRWRLMMGITFILWGIEALMPLGLPRLIVRDVVVLMFILDLFLMILDWRPFGGMNSSGSGASKSGT